MLFSFVVSVCVMDDGVLCNYWMFKFTLYCGMLSVADINVMMLITFTFPTKLNEFIELARVLIESSQAGILRSLS